MVTASPPSVNPWALMEPSGTGARLASWAVTIKRWNAALPPGSRAITVMVAVPAPTGVTVTILPSTLTVATEASEELAV